MKTNKINKLKAGRSNQGQFKKHEYKINFIKNLFKIIKIEFFSFC